MTSLINPTLIDITYPIAGQDNDTQGFRTNYINIKNNFIQAATEITNLQANVNYGNANVATYLTMYTGNITAGNLFVGASIGYTDVGILETIASNTAGYNQMILQNRSSATNASTNFNVSNNLANATTNYGEFGMNSSNFTGVSDTGVSAFSAPGAVYLASATTDLALGTYNLGNIHFVVNSSATDAMTITNTGLVTLSSAIQFANLTTTQINNISTPSRGMTVYNYNTGNIQVYNGTKWANLTLS